MLLSVVAAALLLGVFASGCASMRGGVEGDFGRAAQQIGSAAVSAQLSLQVFADGRNTTAATDIALSDMLEEVDQAVSATADRGVDTPEQGALRAEVLQAANTVTGQIIRGRDIVAGVGEQTELTAVAAELGRAGTELLDLGDRLEAAG
ncbi:hypothetical protein [Rhodococcus rhodochrous]|uniref:hypothetical protein n=1 Tax=Rhodococcus rhodochrous TaxID=1829 RepID=UPI001E63753F|nr:hypothetical protein [Rhodococcus rhodochrous]MCD2100301.1 hypothetical protein [Rhodococcus rhodochrous]MCD2124205.1 hypothetical protein [Rhodococcus rhodochrous]MCQ4137835.1 hypothetical protein [Rhodococcus rhodochrous]MDJ0021482.1 hypothetical protein [Rhodococcus rhodochrous]